jgi:hypothetical protein
MTENTRKTMVFGLLIVACIWGYYNLSGYKARHTTPPTEVQMGEADQAGTADPATVTKAPADRVSPEVAAAYDAKPWGRNPFYRNSRAVETSKPTAQQAQIELHLLGILYREIGAQAFISGRVVAVGDTILGYKVTAIAPDFVALENGASNMKLRVKKESM